MSVALSSPVRGYQERLRLAGHAAFVDAMGSFGRSVPPRGRHQARKEEFCLRRLLVAWDRTRRLDLPLVIWTAGDGKGGSAKGPDFILDTGDRRFGVEVTTAGDASWHRWSAALAEEQPTLLPSGDGYSGSQPERAAAAAIGEAVRKKSELYSAQYAPVVGECHLLVYENSEGGFLARKEEAIERAFEQLSQMLIPFAGVHVIFGETVFLDVAGNAREQVDVSLEYADDLSGWAEAQARLLREGRVTEIDVENLAEELASLGRSDRRALRSHLVVLLLHLLKWRYQPARRGSSWQNSIVQARAQIEDLLAENPSFAAGLPDAIARSYDAARREAARETGLSAAIFPRSCPFDEDDVLGRTSLEETPADE